MNIPRYSSSGIPGALTLPLFAVMAVGAAGVAWLYALLCRVVPIIYLNMLTCVVFGFALGYAAKKVIRSGPCRNMAVSLLLTAGLATTAVAASHGWNYFAGLQDLHERYPDVSLEQLAEEIPFLAWVDARVERGWTVRNTTHSGPVVYVVWLLEAGVLLGLALYIPWVEQIRTPFCEKCHAWTRERGLGLPGLTRAEAEPHLRNGDLSSLVRLAPGSDPSSDVRLSLKISFCATCSQTSYFTVEEKRFRRDAKGGPHEKTRVLLRNAILRADDLAHLQQRIAARDAEDEAAKSEGPSVSPEPG